MASDHNFVSSVIHGPSVIEFGGGGVCGGGDYSKYLRVPKYRLRYFTLFGYFK